MKNSHVSFTICYLLFGWRVEMTGIWLIGEPAAAFSKSVDTDSVFTFQMDVLDWLGRNTKDWKGWDGWLAEKSNSQRSCSLAEWPLCWPSEEFAVLGRCQAWHSLLLESGRVLSQDYCAIQEIPEASIQPISIWGFCLLVWLGDNGNLQSCQVFWQKHHQSNINKSGEAKLITFLLCSN